MNVTDKQTDTGVTISLILFKRFADGDRNYQVTNKATSKFTLAYDSRELDKPSEIANRHLQLPQIQR